jgi:hypothetical protein
MLIEKIIYIILGLAALIWGFSLCYTAVRNIILFRNVKSFPSIIGTILSTKINEVNDDGRIYYCPEVQYKFAVNGVFYESNQMNFRGVVNCEDTPDKASAIIDKYPKGSQVIVYYKPNNPQYSALKFSSITGDTIAWSIGGAIILSGGVVFLLVGVGVIF